MNLKKIIIFPVIIFLILLTIGTVLSENSKYEGLNETSKRTFEDMEQSCKSHDTTEQQRNCMDSVDKMIEQHKQSQRP